MYKSLWYLAGVYAIAVTMACHSKKEEKNEIAKLSVTNPLFMDTAFLKEYVAEIPSIQNIEVRVRVNGFLETINVHEGQLVNAGQTLFTIRSREYEAE
jgi:membrane fusion protein, multidrug efflux system